jgi:GT2 family glycosyltransferase
MNKDISILIVNFNTTFFLLKFLKYIHPFINGSGIEVIVVDNSSTDFDRKIIGEYPDIRFLLNDYNYGFSRAMNQAFEVSAGRYVMSFNPDAEVEYETLLNIVDFMDKNPKVGKAGLLAENSNGEVEYPETSFSRFPTFQLLKIIKGKIKAKHLLHAPTEEVEWIFGTGIVIRRALFPANVLYPVNSFLFWEEYWLSKYVVKSGYKIVVTGFKIKHHASVSFKFNPQRMYWAKMLSLAVGYRVRSEHYGALNNSLNLILTFFDFIIIVLLLQLKNIFRKKTKGYYMELHDYKSRAAISLKLFLGGKNSALRLEEKAIRFFNNGVLPPYKSPSMRSW